jgi:hypothetical protein
VGRRVPSEAAVEQVGVHEHREPAVEAEAIPATRDRISPAGGATSAVAVAIVPGAAVGWQPGLGLRVVLVALTQRVDVLAEHILHLREI